MFLKLFAVRKSLLHYETHCDKGPIKIPSIWALATLRHIISEV